MLSVHAADNFGLADGSTLSGDVVTFNDAGVIIRLPGDKYTERMPWTQFSQEGLQQLGQNPKIKPLVEPFMELPPVEKVHATEDIQLKAVSRLERPAQVSLFGALFSSSVGFFMIVLVYLANLYGAFEVAVCRGRPVAQVMGLSAILPIVGPGIFYFLPTKMADIKAETNAILNQEGEHAAAAASGQPGSGGAGSSSSEPNPDDLLIQVSAIPAVSPEQPSVQSFKRGQFTFNRRFMETKFAGFTQATRSEADNKLDLFMKISQGEVLVQRITKIGANDITVEIFQGGAWQEQIVAFADIQEITIKSKTN